MSLSKDEKKTLRGLEKKMGYSFKNPVLLKKALTHKSHANEMKLPADTHNERLEFLGDAVLELAITELLMERYPRFSEGELSKLRAAIVNETQLAGLATELDLGKYLYLGKGEEHTEGRKKNSLLSDAYEALLGAMYLDGGPKKTFAVIHKRYNLLLDGQSTKEFYRDFKTELQELSQSLFKAIPHYCLISEKGPDHDKTFEVEIYIKDQLLGTGQGRNKKASEQEAARQALEKMRGPEKEKIQCPL